MSSGESWIDQRERRFRLSREQAQRVLEIVPHHLPPLRYTDSADRSVVVTTYLDTPDLHYLGIADASAGERSLKLRIREYLHREGTGWAYEPICYLERKARTGEVRHKQRVEVDKRDVNDYLLRRAALSGSAEAEAIAAEIDGRALSPTLVCAYERRVFGADRGLRITYDERIAFYPAPRGLYDVVPALTPLVLGSAHARGPSRLVEVKQASAEPVPLWLEALLADLPPASDYSKFRDGVHALAESDGPVELTRPLIAIDR